MNVPIFIVLALVAIFAVVLLYLARLSGRWKVEARISIDASREQIFSYLNDLRNWEEWTIWNQNENPNFIFHYRGEETGVGAQQCWKNKKQYGSVKITGNRIPETLEYLLVFSHSKSHLDGTFDLLPRGTTTELVWCLVGDAGKSPLRKVMARIFVGYIHRDCVRSLKQLKTVMESKSRS